LAASPTPNSEPPSEDEGADESLVSSFHVYERGTGAAISVADISKLPGLSAPAAVAADDVSPIPTMPQREWRPREECIVTARFVMDKGRSRTEERWEELPPPDVVVLVRDMRALPFKLLGLTPLKRNS
jgi:hypothetical protein